MIQSKNKKAHIAQLAICAFLVVLIVWILSRIYAIILISPDDIAFQNIMAGETTGVPDGHTYFLQYPLSFFLSLFYRINRDIAWYQAFLIGSIALCLFLIFSRVVHVKKSKKLVYLIFSPLFAVLLFAGDIVHLEWTITAGILGATAVFRYFTIPSNLSLKECIFEYAICVLLLLLCFCLRNTVAYMFMPLAGICWLKKIADHAAEKTGEGKTQIIRHTVFLVVCLIAVGAVMLSHNLAYSSEEWKIYKDYTKDRSALFDYYGYPDYDTYADVYQEAGITQEAYRLMKSDYNYLVPCDNFKNIDLKAIADLAREIHFEDPAKKAEKTYNTIKSILTGDAYLILNAVIVILIACNFCKFANRKATDILFIAAVVLWALGISIYLAYKGRFPERIVRCLDYGLIMTLLANLFNPWSKKSNKNKKNSGAAAKILCVLIAISMMGAIYSIGITLKTSNDKKIPLAKSHLQLIEYCASHPENAYFRDFWSFSQRGELFMVPAYNLSNNYLGIGGWTYHSPIYDALLEQWDCVDFYQAVKENQNLYYLVNESRLDHVYALLNGYFSSIGSDIRMSLVDGFYTDTETVYVLQFIG